jgi:hypothetical protein
LLACRCQLGDKREALVTCRFKKRRAEGFDVVWGFVSDVEEEELDIVAEAGDSAGRRQLLVARQDDGIDESDRGRPVTRMLSVGDDLVDVAAVDSDRALAGNLEFQKLVRRFCRQPRVLVLGVENEASLEDL